MRMKDIDILDLYVSTTVTYGN